MAKSLRALIEVQDNIMTKKPIKKEEAPKEDEGRIISLMGRKKYKEKRESELQSQHFQSR